MVMGYQAYAGNGLLDGITTGVGLRQKYDDMKRRQGLATGMRKVADGDESGWADVAENAPEVYMQKKAQDIQNERLKWDQEHRNDITPYQQAMLGLKRQELAQNELLRKAQEDAKKQAEADALAKQQAEEQKSLDNAQAGVNALKEIAEGGKLSRFQDSWFNKLDKDIQREQGKLSGAVAAIAPRAIAKLKAAGVSGVNTLGEFMTYVGLPQNATSEQISAAVPLIAQIIGVEDPTKKANEIGTPSISEMSDEDLLKGL